MGHSRVFTWDHVTVVWGAYLLGYFLTPSGSFDVLVAQVMRVLSFLLDVGGVADSLKPSAAHFSGCLVSWQSIPALLDQGIVTGSHCVVECNLLETDLASLPVCSVVTLFLLHGFELCHICVMAG